MSKIISFSLCFLFLMTTSAKSGFAQKEKKINPKHQNIYKESKIETDELIIELVDANAQLEFSKMKIKITNKTNDYILYKPGETEFIYDFGTVNPKGGLSLINGKDELIEPKGSNSRVISASGNNNFHVDEFTVNLTGFYRISTKGKVHQAPDFQLPPATNDFETGPFKVLMTSISKQTQQTAVRFKVTFVGDAKHYGMVRQGKVACRIENGQEFAMSNSKDKTVLLADGADDKFSVYYEIPAKITDMQFATMHLIWKDTFMESEVIPLKVEAIKLTLDIGKTAAKN